MKGAKGENSLTNSLVWINQIFSQLIIIIIFVCYIKFVKYFVDLPFGLKSNNRITFIDYYNQLSIKYLIIPFTHHHTCAYSAYICTFKIIPFPSLHNLFIKCLYTTYLLYSAWIEKCMYCYMILLCKIWESMKFI